MSHILGIDLGTTGSTASVLLDDGKLHSVPSVEKTHSAEKPFPSVVSFFQDGSCLIGDSALEQSIYNPIGTIKNVKKYMGTPKKFKIFEKEYIPQYIAALILMKIKLSAEELTKEKFEHAVITVPAYFDEAQRRATREAGRIAGLNVLQLINEPEAAAIAYGAHKISSKTRIMVFDMGAGTLDVSILEADSSVTAKPFQVLAVSGDNELGGIYMDDLVKDFLLRSIMFDDGKFSASDKIYQRFRESTSAAEEEESPSRKKSIELAERKRVGYQMDIIAENAKIALSTEEKTTIDESISYEKEEHKLKTELTRKEFEKMIGELLRRAESKITDVLENANLTSDKIDKVILVGGPTKIPIVRNMLKKLVKEPESDVDPTFAVSNGAAIWGAILNNDRNLPVIYKGVALLSVTPKALGEQYRDEERNTSILLMIPKNTPYPTRFTDTFFNNLRNDGKWRDSAPMDVWQGNPKFQKPHDFSQYKKIGHFEIEGLKHGISNEIEVTYEIDNDGILTVSAREIGGDAYAELQINKSGETFIPTLKLQDLRKDAEKIERKTRDILSPYEVPPEEWKTPKNPKYCWMCECLDDAKKILNAHHSNDCPEFFKIAKFRLFIQQLEMQYAFAHIQLTHPVYSIGIHNALKKKTEPNKRMLTIVLVHELLHALHPDWGHNRIIPEERRLANLAGYFDAFIEMDRLFLSGKMSLCNNHFSSDFDFKEINCD
jgi:molecular chaperone DnaK